MPTLAEENKKILRRSLDVIVGMDIPFEEISSVTASGNYSGSSGVINQAPQEPVLMDLSNGGFFNDGLAIPLGDDTGGFVSNINTNLVLSVTLSSASDDDLIVVGYLGGNLIKWTFSGSGASRTVTIPANSKRIVVNRVVCGQAFWFDNSSLVSCNLQLRAVETKVDNPELQMSEIEIEGYEPNDITDVIGYIGTGYPIYYTSGYPGDMAPIRKFYLGESIGFEDHIVKIKGYDATYKLDNDCDGLYFEDDDTTDAYVKIMEVLSNILTNAGVQHELDINPYFYDNGIIGSRGIFIDKQPTRSIFAYIVNVMRKQPENNTSLWSESFTINYVDAGIPKLWIGRRPDFKTLENISKPKVIVDKAIRSISQNAYYSILMGDPSTVETVDADGVAIYETQNPYYTFTTNRGTISRLSPYTYKLDANGSATISGRQILFGGSGSGDYGILPTIVYSDANLGEDITLQDWFFNFYITESTFKYLLKRSNISYEFEYRGDPNLQPRDYIRADIDGSGTLVDMTIDTIELKHEGGGTSSTIVARKGFI